jgi:membrane-bound lytic murein transglycosylase D
MKNLISILCLSLLFSASSGSAAVPGKTIVEFPESSPSIRSLRHFKKDLKEPLQNNYSPPVFDFPVTYNYKVKNWIEYFQTTGKSSFKKWLERSARYAPYIQKELQDQNLPQDLLYVAMIESGFTAHAESHAGAVGIWQFIAPTARRYGLTINWWVDERRNYTKATKAAIRYKKVLYGMFGSWHLVSASYNSGENRIARLIKEHQTNNFWELAEMQLLPEETTNYVPKIIAATLIAKSPALYGFKDLNYSLPFRFEETYVPGGTDLNNLAQYIGVKEKYLKDLNPELLKGFIPREIKQHMIKVPIGSKPLVKQYSELITHTTI